MLNISTATVFNNQTSAINQLYSQYEEVGQELSTGISLTEPSDDPTVIAQDLSVRNSSAVTGQVSQNLTDLNNMLSTTDSTLSSLTGILQSARNLAIEGAQDTISSSQRAQIGDQVNQLLEEAINLANTEYDGKYIFAGSAVPPGDSLVQAIGNPPTQVVADANSVQQVQELPSGDLVPTNVTLQQAFNMGSSNGSPSVFQMLITLRDTLENGSVVNESSTQVNVSGQAVAPTTTLASLADTNPPVLTVPLQLDSNDQVGFSIASSIAPTGVNFYFPATTSLATIVASINADTAETGVEASFNYQSQRLSLTDVDNESFTITNIASTGSAATTNFTSAMLLGSTADVVNYLSTQLGDIDSTITAALGAAGAIGATVQAVQGISSTESERSTQDTNLQSDLEDTNVAQATSQFTLVQTALEAAYSTTSRIEQEDLFDYLNNT